MPMDPKFLEWFGQMLILSAKNLGQAENFFRYFREGFPAGAKAEKWLEPYLRLLPRGKEEPAEDFQNLIRELFRNLGVVSREEYDELRAEHERLQAEFNRFRTNLEQVREVETRAREKNPDLAHAWLGLIQQVTQANTRLFEFYRKWWGLER